MATLRENLEAIKLEKETKILPQNIRKRSYRFRCRRYNGNGRFS